MSKKIMVLRKPAQRMLHEPLSRKLPTPPILRAIRTKARKR